MVTLVVGCTAGKALAPIVRGGEVARTLNRTRTVEAFAKAWASRLLLAMSKGPSRRARDMYVGKNIALVKSLLAVKRMLIVSTGYGFLDSETSIVSYSLTASQGGIISDDDKLTKLLVDFDRAAWWAAINRHMSGLQQPLAHTLSATRGLIVIALSRDYLEMTCDDLACVSDQANMVVVGQPSASMIKRLAARSIAYDPPFPDGPRINRPLRAAAHFIDRIVRNQGDHRTIDEYRGFVERDIRMRFATGTGLGL